MERMTVDQLKKKASPRTRLEDKFLAAVKAVMPKEIPDPEREHRFHPTRRWRFDFAWPAIRLAVEIHGGSFVRGGHNRGVQQASDYEKLNEAQRLGWRVAQFGTKQMADAEACAHVVLEMMCSKLGETK